MREWSRAEPVCLLAGAGRFPIAFAHKAREAGLRVLTLGIADHADASLEAMSWRFRWIGPFRLGSIVRHCKAAGARRLVMAGKLHKAELMYRPWRLWKWLPDWRTVSWWFFRRRRDNKDDTVLLSVIEELGRDGLAFASALDLCPELLVKPGAMTRRVPTTKELADIEFGWELAKAMGGLDVGQSVMVKDRVAVAVEAVEGTDQAIRRAGELCRKGGFTVVKVAKPRQDMRFDVPTIGTATVETIHQAGGKVLAIEAEKTIVLDQEDTVRLADRLGISIVALADGAAQPGGR
ncbi:MAG: UDP-2,3-diacylglucosamine diphosphatase LpxI [Gemmataceae bacterium]|nr:UDP-2,3-diacylglucosamine diphosphatase LpxI [Gemmataceae bacterium]